MNRIHSKIWNKSLGQLVVASELATRQGPGGRSAAASRLRNGALAALAVGSFALASPLVAQTAVSGTAGNTAGNGKNATVDTQCGTNYVDRVNPGNPKPGSGQYYLESACSTAIGNNANATGGGTAIGDRASSEGGVAIGVGATSTGNSGTAIGPNALAVGNTAIAMGRQSAGIGAYAIALGNVSYAKDESTIAIGHSAFAEGYRSVAIGSSDSQNAGNDGVSAGANYNTISQTRASGSSAVAIGGGATTSVDYSVALGASSVGAANASGRALFSNDTIAAGGAVSVGASGAERQIRNVAGGTARTDAVNVGQLSTVNDDVVANTNSITNLDGRVTTTEGNIQNLDGRVTVNEGDISALQDDALQWNAGANGGNGAYSAAHGGNATSKLTNIAAGTVSANSTDAVNGSQLNTTNQNVTNVGNQVTVLGNTLTAVAGDTGATYVAENGRGVKYVRTNDDGLADADAHATVAGATALGYNATASHEQSVAIGRDALADGSTLGQQAYAIGGTAIGEVSVGNAGTERRVTHVAAGATDTDAVNVGQLKTVARSVDELAGNAVQYDDAAKGTVTFGGTASADGGLTGGTRLSNVAQGDVSANSTDAVNGSQLNTTNQNVTNVGNRVTVLGDTLTAVAGDTGAAYVAQNGRGVKYVRTNDDGLAEDDAHALAQGSTALGYGATTTVDADDSVAIGRGAAATDANAVALGSGSVTREAVAVASATVGSLTFSGFAGASPGSVVSVGSAGAERQIVNVAAGRISADSTDAVNGSQLYAVATHVSDLDGRVGTIEKGIGDIADGAAGMFQVSQDHNDVAPTATGTNAAAGGAGAVASGSNALAVGNDSAASAANTTALGTDAAASGTNATAVGQGAVASGTGSTALGQGASATADGSVALGAGASDGGRGAESYTGKYSGAQNDTVGTVSVGNAATGETRTVSNVADGREATDAVNVRQLDGAVQAANDYTDSQIGDVNTAVGNMGKQVNQNTTDITNLQNGKDGYFQVSDTDGRGKPQAAGDNSLAGGAGAQASGKGSTALGTGANASADNAVAVGNGSVADRANSVSVGSVGSERQVTNVAAGTAATDAANVGQLNAGLDQVKDWSRSYTDQRFDSVDRDLNRLGNRANAGIASAMAMASLPQAYQPDQSAASVALGNFHGETGIAIGLSTVTESGRYVLKLNASSNTRGDTGVGVGAGMVW